MSDSKLVKRKYFSIFFNKNFLIFSAITFFILYKFWLISTVLGGRTSLPEPDDTYTYLSLVNLIRTHGILGNTFGMPDYSNIKTLYLPYTALLAYTGNIFNLSSETIFKAYFYIGTIILPFTLWVFYKTFIKDKRLIAFLIFFLAFYNGSGAYHGFFWVVPSFFAFLLFLLLFCIILLKTKYWYLISFILTLPFILIHPISVYSPVIFILWAVVYSILEKRVYKILFLRSLVISLFSLFWVIITTIYYQYRGVKVDGEYSIFGAVRALSEYSNWLSFIIQKNSVNMTTKMITLPISSTPISSTQEASWNIMKQEYFNILFPVPIFIVIFCLILFLLYKRGYKWLVSLYFASIIFCIISNISWFGYRSLMFLWPVTFMVIGVFFYECIDGSFIKLASTRKLIFKFVTIIVFIAFITGLTTLNYIFSKNINLRNRIAFNPSCIKESLNQINPKTKIYYENKSAYAIFSSIAYYEEPDTFKNDSTEDKLLISADINNSTFIYNNLFIDLILNNTSRRNIRQNIVTQPENVVPPTAKLLHNCGDIKIYGIKDRQQ